MTKPAGPATGSPPTGSAPAGSPPTGSAPAGGPPAGSTPTRSWPTGSRLRDIQEASYLLHLMAERQQAQYSACAAEFGLTAAQAKVLMSLQPGESVPMRALAQRARSDPSNFTGLVDKLEARGAIKRTQDPADRRVKTLRLTGKGRLLRDQFWQRLTHDPGPIAPLSPAQVRQLRDLLLAALGLPAKDA